VSTPQTWAHGQQDQEEGEEGHAPAGIHSAGHGAEQVGQASHEGVGGVQAGYSPRFLPLPSPPDIEGDGDPHRQAAEVADGMKRQHLLFGFFVFTLLFLFHSYFPNVTTLSIRALRLTRGPVSDNWVRAQQCGQSLHCDQRCGQKQHRSVCVAEKDQEAQGNNIYEWGQLSQPGIRDAKETQKSCGRKIKLVYVS